MRDIPLPHALSRLNVLGIRSERRTDNWVPESRIMGILLSPMDIITDCSFPSAIGVSAFCISILLSLNKIFMSVPLTAPCPPISFSPIAPSAIEDINTLLPAALLLIPSCSLSPRSLVLQISGVKPEILLNWSSLASVTTLMGLSVKDSLLISTPAATKRSLNLNSVA